MNISGKTKICGLFGFPVAHTLSPAMHNAAFQYLNINSVYLPFSVDPKKIKDAVSSLVALDLMGVNVTVPHKQEVMKYLDSISKEAKIIGAVNTIVVRDGKLHGYNTDGMGFIASIEEDLKIDVKGMSMFLLGAGGGGRAVAVQSALSGLKKVYISDKDHKRAKDLVKSVPGKKAELLTDLKEIRSIVRKSDIIVNATPIGLHEDDPVSIPPEWIPEGKVVYDLIYNPAKTKLLMSVRGCVTVNGLGMLLHQGAKAFELWTGEKAPVEIMRKAITQ